MKKTTIYFLISFLAGIITYFLPLGIESQAQMVLSILVTVGLLWLTEAMPIHITSLFIPLLLVIFGSYGVKDVFVPFFDPVIVLLMGGFALAYGLQKFKLDEVIAYFFIHTIGTSPKRFLLAIMLATAFLSMWMSNSATSAVMMPIAVVILVDSGLKKFESSYTKAVVLGVAFAATIGGLSTIVGTTPNAMAVKFLADQGTNLTFLDWMYHTFPFTLIFVLITWFVLLTIYKPDVEKLRVRRYFHRLDLKQKRTLIIFGTTALLWLTAGLHKISISLIALVPIFLFYILKLFNKNDFGKFHWDILVLVGGGLSLGAAINSSGLNIVMANFMQTIVGGHHLLIVLFLTSLFCILMTVFSSNTGTAAFIIPTIIPLAASLGIDERIMVVLAGVSVSLDFMVPIGTPPNAIAYSTGYIHIKDMIKAGIVLALIGAFLLSFFAWLYW